jgi:hypothetical protein
MNIRLQTASRQRPDSVYREPMMFANETIHDWFRSHRILGRCLLVVVLVLCSGGVNGTVLRARLK